MPSPICCAPGVTNNRGQGTIEYILVLVVAVTIILGGLYQLNTAFKSWANNYFGDYLSCLLETGELPNLGGQGGGNGICDQMFKPFTLADGRPAKNPIEGTGGGEDGGDSKRSKAAGNNGRVGGSGGDGYGGSGGRFTGGRGGVAGATNKARRKAKSSGINTGSTSASDYGSGYSYTQRPQRFQKRSKLNNKFAFDEEKEVKQTRRVAANSKKGEEGGKKENIKLKKSDLKTKRVAEADTGFTIGNFLKFLIIAAIIIALFMFLGGQVLSISKSMD